MLYNAVDSLFIAVANAEAACETYERLGLRPVRTPAGFCSLAIGSAGHAVRMRFLTGGEAAPLVEPCRQALSAGRGLFAVGLRVNDLDTVLSRLTSRGVRTTEPFRFDPGGEAARVAWLPLHDRAGADLVLVQQDAARAAPANAPTHALPLRRLDHLAAVAPDLEAKTRFWCDVLEVPLAGEVVTPSMVIRQLRIGDAVLELLGPASADSPLRQRPPGLVGMASWEVADAGEAVRQARAVGFTVSDPAAGPLPGTRIATVAGSELAGVNMQLLQYV